MNYCRPVFLFPLFPKTVSKCRIAGDPTFCQAFPIFASPSDGLIHSPGPTQGGQEEAPKIVVVVNTQRNMAHRVKLPSKVSLCLWYTCGSPDQPAPNAKFTPVGRARKCNKCFGCN